MTAPANLTYSDIEQRVMNSCRLSTGNATQQTRVQAVINAVYRDIYNKSDWSFAEKRAVINTAPNLISGASNVFGVTAPASVNVTVNSSTIVFSSAITQDISRFSLLIPGAVNDSLAVYKIASHGGASATAVLDANFTNPTSTASAYQLYQDEYSLPADAAKVLQVRRYGYESPVYLVGKEAMMQMKLTDTTVNKPMAAAVTGFQTQGDPTTPKQLIVHPYPDKAYRLEILYKQQLNDELTGTTQPFIPDEWREVMWYGAMARCYPIFLNDDARGQQFEKLFNDTVALMVAQQKEYARDNAGVKPADIYRRRSRTRNRAAGGMTMGTLFDRYPDEP
jgi:hypothetical protein